jgi:hypothetical protein
VKLDMTNGVTGSGVLGRRDLHLGLAIGLFASLVYVVLSPPGVGSQHTPFNHFALLAEAWLDGRLALDGPAPAYARNNDFASFQGRTYVVFPPLPALVLVPFVALFGSAQAVPDGLVFALLAGLAPAFLFLALEKLRRLGRSARSEREHCLLALCFAFGSVYFVTAVQGTVWYAAHVVGTTLASLYVLVALGGKRPFAAGALLGLAFAARAPLIFAFPLFVTELVRAKAPPSAACPLKHPLAIVRALPQSESWAALARFALPIAIVLGLVLAHNLARFGDPFEFGYRYLTIAWRDRIERWGLFDYHYLARNLGVVLTSLPWIPGSNAAPLQINHHGLALWVTTPLYLALIGRCCWRRHPGLTLAAVGTAVPSLFYQNTGWTQFGYRFSNDYAPFLFALLAVSGVRLRGVWGVLAGLSLVINLFGAMTFGRSEYARFYFTDPSQRILYQPD